MNRDLIYSELKRAGVKDPSGLVAQAEAFGTPDNMFGIRAEDANTLGIDPADPQQNFAAAVQIESGYQNVYNNDELTRAAFIGGAPENATKKQINKVRKIQSDVKTQFAAPERIDSSKQIKDLIRKVVAKKEVKFGRSGR